MYSVWSLFTMIHKAVLKSDLILHFSTVQHFKNIPAKGYQMKSTLLKVGQGCVVCWKYKRPICQHLCLGQKRRKWNDQSWAEHFLAKKYFSSRYGGIQVSRNGVLTKAILIGDPGNTRHRGKYHPTVDFLFEWFGFDPTSKAVTNSTWAKQQNPNKISRRSAV